jgi:RHS repeat-associated protein
VDFGVQSLFRIDRYSYPNYIRHPDGTQTISGYTTQNAIRPAFGTVHFGFIRNLWQDGLGQRQYTQESSITLLEDGQEYDSTTAFAGTTLSLPLAYGFAAPSSPMVDDTSAHLFYDTTAAGLSANAANLVNSHLPSGFGTASTTYKVVMDKSIARVFASVPALGGWVPVLWLDRFGHSITFQWTRATTGLAAGITAQTSVVALNSRGQGVEVRWADWSSTSTVQDLARVDFLGMAAPSMLVRGYSGITGAAPTGFTSTLLTSPPLTTITAPLSSSGGPVGRPTEVLSGDPASLPQPSWNNSGPAPANQPSITPSSSPSTPIHQWTLQWDANAATVTGFTSGSQGLSNSLTKVTSTFTYQSCTIDGGFATYAVTQADDMDGAANAHRTSWARTPTNNPLPDSVKVQDWWPSAGSPDHAWIYSAFDTSDSPGTTVLQDASGATLATTTTSGSTSTAYAASLGLLNTQNSTSYTTGSTTQPAQVSFSVANGSGAMTLIQQTTNTYLDRSAMLDDSEVTKTVTTRFTAAGAQIAPVQTVASVYDAPSTGQPLLQRQKSYQQTGAWQHGATYTYDAQGRASGQGVYDSPDNGTTVNTAPQSVVYAYDGSAGALASATITYLAGSGTATLTQTWSGFDTLGRPSTATDATGVSATTSLDLLGRVYQVARPGRPTVGITWSGDNQTRTVTAGSQTGTDTYDGFGRLVKRQAPDGRVTTYLFDANGRRSTVTEVAANGASTRQTTSTYDVLGRVLSETDPDGVMTTFSYALSGLNTVKTAINSATLLKVDATTDPFGQTVSQVVSDWQSGAYVVVKTSAFTYDGAGHLTQAVESDPSGVSQTRTFTYSADGRLTGKMEPETGAQTFSTFNALGLATSVGDGVRTRTLAYDGLGRLVSATGVTESLGYTYTGAQLTAASSVSSGQTITQSFTYGSAATGALLAGEGTQTPDFSSSIGYGYTGDGQLHSITYPSGRVVTYGYDTLGRVQTVSQTAPGGMSGATVATVGYDAAWGLESSLQFASGASSLWTTQADGLHLKQWSIQLPNGTKLDGDRLYNYDASKDNLSQAGEWNLTHDTRGRLTQASAPTLNGYAATYGYDAFDNNTSASLSGGTPPQAIPFGFPALPKNQTPSTSGGSATGWVYDAAGEATNFGAGVGSTPQTGLVWDGLGRLSQVNAPGLTEIEGYAPSGLRVRRDDTTAGLSRRYAYTSDGLLLGEYTPAVGGGFAWNRDVIYVGSQAIAEADANGVHELHSDHLGTPRVVTTTSGGTAVIEGRQAYGAYGETFPVMNSGYQPLTGYTGHVQTDPTGLVYMRGRYYTPIWHRFVNSDQGADPTTFNQMAYVGGSPMMGVDPSGLDVLVTLPSGDVRKFPTMDDFYAWATTGGGGYTFTWTGSDGQSTALVGITATPTPISGFPAFSWPTTGVSPLPVNGGGAYGNPFGPRTIRLTPKPPHHYADCIGKCRKKALIRGELGIVMGFVPYAGTVYGVADSATGGFGLGEGGFDAAGAAAWGVGRVGDIAKVSGKETLERSIPIVASGFALYQEHKDLEACAKKCKGAYDQDMQEIFNPPTLPTK